MQTFSGGTEATTFNINAIEALKRVGFGIKSESSGMNPVYKIQFDESAERIECFSKMIPPHEDPFTYDIAMLIYGTKVAYVDYKEEMALVIDNPRFAKFQERLFRSLFNRL